MTIDFSCQKCDASFELDATDLLEGSERLKCPNCDARAPQTVVDDLASALADLCKQIAALSKKFGVSLSLETDDLPAPYDGDERDSEDEEDEDVEDEEEDEEDLSDDDVDEEIEDERERF